MRRSIFSFVIVLEACLRPRFAVSAPAPPTHDKEKVEANVARRQGNLDHWDPLTLATYIGIDFDTNEPLPEPHKSAASSKPVDAYAGHDAAIMFYAQWCQNCHALAPIWDKIATMLKAGTKQSNLIMALFDCEGSEKHTELCNAAGVTHYPTLIFVGRDELHQATNKKERSILGSSYKKNRRAVRFRGNWQYGEQILDWISFNQSWSTWTNFSYNNPIMRLLRRAFTLPFLRKGLESNSVGSQLSAGKLVEDASLPVGVPVSTVGGGIGSGSLSSSSASAVGSGGDSLQELKQTKAVVEEMTRQVTLLEKTATHAGLLIDSILLPGMLSDKNEMASIDIFHYMKQHTVFARAAASEALTNDTDAVLLKSCVADLTVDYCHRVLTNIVNDPTFLDSFGDATEMGEEKLMKDIEAKLYELRDSTEPFCALVDDCVANEFTEAECQPDQCPFANDIACSYVATCKSPAIMEEYQEELKRLQAEIASETSATSAQSTSSGWGVSP
jgi:thiol-disulfide isomerase/thioredoxin